MFPNYRVVHLQIRFPSISLWHIDVIGVNIVKIMNNDLLTNSKYAYIFIDFLIIKYIPYLNCV